MNTEIIKEVAKRTFSEVKNQIIETPAVPGSFAIFTLVFLLMGLHIFVFLALTIFSVGQVAWFEYKTLKVDASAWAAPDENTTKADPLHDTETKVVNNDTEVK